MTDPLELAKGLGLRASGRIWTGACPSCDYPRAFTAEAQDGRVLVRCHVGCGQDEVIAALRSAGLWGGGRTSPDYPPQQTRCVRAGPAERQGGTDLAAVIERIWRASAPAAGTLADVYLQVRGITLRSLPADLRFVGRLWHTPTSTAWPAMVAVIRDVSGHMIGLHRTFLHPDGSGKAPVEPSKMTLGATGGGAVRLAPAGPALAVSEGIETGLSVMAATGMPTWTGLSAGGIRTLVLPRLPLARTVTIAADSDPVGIEAAYGAAYRWQAEGRLVRIALPPPGMDFNDLARERDHA